MKRFEMVNTIYIFGKEFLVPKPKQAKILDVLVTYMIGNLTISSMLWEMAGGGDH